MVLQKYQPIITGITRDVSIHHVANEQKWPSKCLYIVTFVLKMFVTCVLVGYFRSQYTSQLTCLYSSELTLSTSTKTLWLTKLLSCIKPGPPLCKTTILNLFDLGDIKTPWVVLLKWHPSISLSMFFNVEFCCVCADVRKVPCYLKYHCIFTSNVTKVYFIRKHIAKMEL